MRRRSVQTWLRALLALGLSLGLAATSQATYTHPTSGDPPTDADLVQIGGRAKTLSVAILNLTPYNLTFNSTNSTVQGSTDANRKTHKSFMFAPVGWPGQIPACSGDWGLDDQGNFAFTADSNNTVHPYSFVLTFDDQGGYVSSGRMTWDVHDVYNSTHASQKTVQLSLWLTRNKPDESLRSEIFEVVADALVELIDLIGVAIDPENPIAWIDLFVATSELAKGSQEFAEENTQETGGEKMYAAAYMVPESADATTEPQITTHSSSGETTDGVDVQWADTTGVYSSQIMVTTHLRRGEDMDGTGCCGSSPILGITVWTPDQYRWAVYAAQSSALTREPAGRRINAHLRHHRKEAFTQFCHLYNSLDPTQKQTLDEAWRSISNRKPLTNEEKLFLERIADALENGRTSLKGERIHDRPHEHQRPDPERPEHERPETPVHVPEKG